MRLSLLFRCPFSNSNSNNNNKKEDKELSRHMQIYAEILSDTRFYGSIKKPLFIRKTTN